MMIENRYCVIMAGGVGGRFWPISTSKFPKQFQDILGVGRTMIQQTYTGSAKLFLLKIFLLLPAVNMLVWSKSVTGIKTRKHYSEDR
jgi:mannose-1-phosphate guanylyltransferase